MLEPTLLAMWFAVVGLGFTLGLIALRAVERVSARVAVVGVVVVLGGVTYAAGERVLGNARPVAFELVKPTEPVRVLYAQARQDEGIFLLIATEKAPTYFRLPWNEDTAKQLRDALEQSQQAQTALMFRFEPSLEEREPMFYAMPQPSLPEKEPPEDGFEYKDREWRI